MGGRIGKARSGWNIGVKKMTFVRDFEGSKLFGDLKEIPQSASIIEVHQDEVRAHLSYFLKVSIERILE